MYLSCDFGPNIDDMDTPSNAICDAIRFEVQCDLHPPCKILAI
jgi:hypothetical protein